MSYFIRSEITYRTGEHSVTFWRGASDPAMWVYHPSDAAQFSTVTAARKAFKGATGYFPGQHPQDRHTINVVGGQ
jgi:hypothetical protein